MREKRNPDGPTSTFSISILVELSSGVFRKLTIPG
jgi:hypothetical protein